MKKKSTLTSLKNVFCYSFPISFDPHTHNSNILLQCKLVSNDFFYILGLEKRSTCTTIRFHVHYKVLYLLISNIRSRVLCSINKL